MEVRIVFRRGRIRHWSKKSLIKGDEEASTRLDVIVLPVELGRIPILVANNPVAEKTNKCLTGRHITNHPCLKRKNCQRQWTHAFSA